MAGFKTQAWVTSALNDEDVSKALVLLRSLRKSFTSKSSAVIVSPKVSLILRDLLSYEFDSVHMLEEDRNLCGLKGEDFAKLFALTLTVFEKGVYLSTKMLIMKNCDQIFENSAPLTFMEDMDTSVFCFKPSMDTFRTLMQGLVTINGNRGCLEKFLDVWQRNQWKELEHLEKRYNKVISLKDGLILGEEKDISIVNFAEDPLINVASLSEDKFQSMGMINQMASKYWQDLFTNDVRPIMDEVSRGIFPSMSSKVGQYEREPIAIVGMSCRFPGSNNLEEFWKLILNGVDAVRPPPDFRWTRDQATRSHPDYRKTNAGFLNVPVDEFDAKFFGISPKEVVYMDPQHRLLHELVWEGLEDAAIDALKLRGSNTGVFMGSWTNDYKDILVHAGNKEFYRLYMGNSIGAAAARISFLLGLTGPSVATESGCSSAMVAVHLACRSLLLGETNLALACGVNLLLHPFDKDEMPMVISPTGRCKTFDSKADGFARGEGCGVLVLKRLSDAIRDNDHIWALVRGSGMTQEGVSRSMGTPTQHCEALAMELALKDAKVDPEEVSYVEAHGTGTVVGDPMEVSAIAKAYGTSRRDKPLLIGSVKTNVAHTESCSGITGIMKVVLAMHHGVIPPHRNFESLNPSIDLDAIPARIPLEPEPWPKSQDRVRLAGVSSFGITGTDAHAIIEEVPNIHYQKPQTGLERPLHILKISAKSEEALQELCRRYQDHLENLTDDPDDLEDKQFQNFLYTANAGRASFNQRAALVARNKEEAVRLLQKGQLIRGEVNELEREKICFLFTGQGSQYEGMAKDLYETSPIFRMHFEYCEKILRESYNINIREALWPDKSNGRDHVDIDISRTIYSQTSIFCVEYALMKLWQSWGVKPDFVLGHSLGEYAAAVCSQILSVEEALLLVAERSRLIDLLPGGKMLVIKADKATVDGLLKKFAGTDKSKLLDCAAVNSNQQTVLAGDSDVIMEFGRYCEERNVKTLVLGSTHAFHSKHMDPMLESFYGVAEKVKYEDLKEGTPQYISGLRGALIEGEEIDAEYWVEHTRDKVKFLTASRKAVELGCKIFIEIGPQPVLSALTMMNNETVQISCLPSLKRNESDWGVVLGSLAKLYTKGVDIDWKGVDQFYHRKIVQIPHYPFQGKRHWPDMMALSGTTIHPLLGSAIPNASGTKIFQNSVSSSSLDFVKDHAIGNNVIFPGACYLEMCLAAGHATVECCVNSWIKPTRPMKVENLAIEAPLRLEETKSSQLQVVVDFTGDDGQVDKIDWNQVKIRIFHRVESELESVKWLHHASATFSPLPTDQEKDLSTKNVDIQDVLKRKDDSDGDTNLIEEVYEKLASLGLKFGPIFQSLKKVWKLDEGSILAEVKVPTEDQNLYQYTLHPVILDAMIQAIMLKKHSDKIKRKLHVPISIGKYIWFQSMEPGDNCFIFTFESKLKPESISAVLFNQEGKLLGLMSEVEFIDTTVKAVESVLEQQTCAMPDIWEETWRVETGPMQYRVPECILKDDKIFLQNDFSQYKVPTEEMDDIFRDLEKYVGHLILNALYDCGWVPEKIPKFTVEHLAEELGIGKDHLLYLRYFIEVLETEGILRRSEGVSESWEILKAPIPMEEVKILLASPKYTEDLVHKFGTTRLLAKVGEALPNILKGKQSGLTVLFPEAQSMPSARDFYDDYGKYFGVEVLIKAVSQLRLKRWNEKLQTVGDSGQKYIYRILEVGAGTGFFTNLMLESLSKENFEFEYMYTDISPAFFSGAANRFQAHGKNMKFKKLNIEEDPTLQGFTPGYYDLIIASDVIHATRDVIESIKNIKKLLRPGGSLDIMEQIQRNRVITFVFGTMEGFWRFQDDLRLQEKHCVLPEGKWREALETSGFERTKVFPMFQHRHGYITAWAKDKEEVLEEKVADSPIWLIFTIPNSKVGGYLKDNLESWGRNVFQVIPKLESSSFLKTGDFHEVKHDNKDDFKALFSEIVGGAKGTIEGIIYLWGLDKTKREQSEILQPLLYLVQETTLSLKQRLAPRLYILTEGVVPLGNNDLSHVYPSTLWGFLKVMRNEHNDMNCRCIGIQEDQKMTSEELQEIFYEIWADDQESQIAFIDNSRCFPRFQRLKPSLQDLTLPGGTDRFQLILPDTKSISDLQFGPLDFFSLGSDEVEVQVKASALNFRDIFSIMKPIDKFKDINTVGFDFAGVIKRIGNGVRKWKTGDLVFGVNLNGGPFPNHVKANENQVKKVPTWMTLCEAATLPAVFCTSYHCLIDVAKVKASDTVLIHAAAGGVGISAIQVLKHIGAQIIATAGSKRKQNFLKDLGIKHIFNSRTTEYGDQILEITNGRGVDVVLNSLTSEGFKEATLKACSKGARFVEMSKLSVWTPDEVRSLRPDVEYSIVDVSSLEPEEFRRLTDSLEEFLERRIVQPIPYTRFDGVNVREALRYLQNAKHIGKVVCAMPEVRMDQGEVKTYTPLFNERSTYLITGGLGGIGFEVANWMIDKGAKHILLVSRSPPSPTIQERIAKRNASSGANLISLQLDVGNYDKCKATLENTIKEMKLPPLRGVMHAAGTLADGVIVNQKWEKLSSTFNAKVQGTLNLHEVTRSMNLEFFVLFSSVASIFGSPGQCNHASGNQFEDTFAHYRHSMGLPATSINWGQWGETGIAVEVDLPGMKALSTLQGLTALEYALRSQRVQTAVFNMESFVLYSKLFPQVAVYLDEKIWKTRGSGGSGLVLRSDEFWTEYDTKVNLEEKLGIVKERLKGILRFILKLDDDERIDDHTNFQEMGVDSLMFVEIKNALQNLLGERIAVSASALRDCNNVHLLSDKLVRLIEGETGENNTKPTHEEVTTLLREDTILPELISSEGIKPCCKVSHIQNILITGVTGTLGPYILQELCKRPGIEKIYCLIRPSTSRNGLSIKERFLEHLEKLQITSQINLSKLEFVEGNVAKDNLGIQNETMWNELSSKVDAVFHYAIKADHTQYYRKFQDDQDVRAVNIQGLKNVLEFASNIKLKHIFHASSLLSVSTTDEEGRLSETWPNFEDYTEITWFAYPISKFVCEILLKKALEKGIPCKTFRFPIIAGHSQTGRSNAIQHNHLMLRYFYIMKCGLMPSNPFPLALVPVDICAQISINLFFDERAPSSDIYNITHDKPGLDQEDFPIVAEGLGYPVELVEFEEFVKKMKEESDDSTYSMFKQMYKNDDELMDTYTSVNAARSWVEGSCDNFWISKKVTELKPDFYEGLPSSRDCLQRDLNFAREQGYFEMYGLKGKNAE